MDGPVDVVVPVYGAHDFFGRCVASPLRHTDLSRQRLVVVLDGPGQDQGRAVAEAASAHVLQNAERRGFVASANRGMAASSHDVVLLNPGLSGGASTSADAGRPRSGGSHAE